MATAGFALQPSGWATPLPVAELLGGHSVLGSIENPIQFAHAVRAGLPSRAAFELFRRMQESTEIVVGSLGALAPIVQKAIQSPDSRLSIAESDVVARAATSLALATDVLGSPDKAVRWLQSPNVALGGESPLQVMDTAAGGMEVDAILGRIEYGVYS